MSSKRQCIKNMSHMFETIDETDDYIVKQCLRCKVKNWRNRNNGIKPLRFVPERTFV